MNYKSFNLGDWIGHISGVIEDETTLDGNEMRDLVEFLSTLKQEPCEDAISRSSVFEIMGNLMSIPYDFDRPINEKDVSESMDEIRALPPVTPTKCIATVKFSKDDMRELIDEKMKDIVVERKKGKWIPRKAKYDNAVPVYECSICHKNNGFENTKYCPNCGSFMITEN